MSEEQANELEKTIENILRSYEDELNSIESEMLETILEDINREIRELIE